MLTTDSWSLQFRAQGRSLSDIEAWVVSIVRKTAGPCAAAHCCLVSHSAGRTDFFVPEAGHGEGLRTAIAFFSDAEHYRWWRRLIGRRDAFLLELESSSFDSAKAWGKYFDILTDLLAVYHMSADWLYDGIQDDHEGLSGLLNFLGEWRRDRIPTALDRYLELVRMDGASEEDVAAFLDDYAGQLFGTPSVASHEQEADARELVGRRLDLFRRRRAPVRGTASATDELVHAIGLFRLEVRDAFLELFGRAIPLLRGHGGQTDPQRAWRQQSIDTLAGYDVTGMGSTARNRELGYSGELCWIANSTRAIELIGGQALVVRNCIGSTSGNAPGSPMDPRLDPNGTTARGRVVTGKGVVTGRAFVVRSDTLRYEDVGRLLLEMEEDSILITTMTYASLVPYLGLVRAIVSERGGLTCHAAVIAREYGIPCIVGVPRVTELFDSGAIVTLDCDAGTIVATDG